MNRRAIWTIAALVLLGICVSVSWERAPALSVAAHSSENPKPGFNQKGELLRPQGYRQWVYVGTPLTPNELNPPAAPFPDFHNVYIHPEDFQHYERTGAFREGTVLVKELVGVGSKQASSGKGYFMGDFIGLEARFGGGEGRAGLVCRTQSTGCSRLPTRPRGGRSSCNGGTRKMARSPSGASPLRLPHSVSVQPGLPLRWSHQDPCHRASESTAGILEAQVAEVPL